MIRFYTRGADKSLARQGSKQAAATKLGIYSTYFPRSSIHFLAHCSNFCNTLKKKIQKIVRPTMSPRQLWPPRWKKNGGLSIVFSVQGTGGSRAGPDPEDTLGDQDTGSPGRPVSSGLQVPGEPGHCRARTWPPWWHFRGVFSFKMSFNCTRPTDMNNTPRC